MKIKIKKLSDAATIPAYETVGSAGMDLYACLDRDMVLNPGDRKLISTGISIELPKGCHADVRSRSGLAIKEGIYVLNAPGLIDSDYRGELGVILHNTSNNSFTVRHGMRIAQIVVMQSVYVEFDEVDQLGDTERGIGGFGSTGR